MKKQVTLMALMALGISMLSNTSSWAAATVTGAQGQSISIKSTTVKAGSDIRVTGKGFDETIGIYLAYCVKPKKGVAPSPCGGGADKSGTQGVSHWISSNAPTYGKGLATPFIPGGRFSQKVTITKKIGKFDCTKVTCAITVRSDHLHEGDRSQDLFIPITISK
jgi:hypothetical protein